MPKGRPKPDISTPAAVKKALLAAKTIGYEDPDFTVAGQGAWEALTKLGITDQVATKSQVELGPARKGFRPMPRIMSSKLTSGSKTETSILACSCSATWFPRKTNTISSGPLPRKISTPIAVVGFISKHASDPAAAKALLQYLASPEAEAIWKDAGYEPHS